MKKSIASQMTEIYKGGEGSGNFGHSGRPGEVGGSGGGDGDGGSKSLVGYSDKTTLGDDGKIRTTDVTDAAKALFEGRKVELYQPKEVSTLLVKLKEIEADARAKGEKAPLYDLCNVSVAGSNLFCAESQGIPRVEMPQLKGIPIEGSEASKMTPDSRGEVDMTNAFVKSLANKDVMLEATEERADFLKASQNELNGVKVAGIAQAIRDGKLDDATLIVSKDNYIVDGHHRWAATVAVDYEDNVKGDLKMQIIRVDMNIIDLLGEAKKFSADMGIPQVSAADKAKKSFRGSTCSCRF
jgi:hypothetical protein